MSTNRIVPKGETAVDSYEDIIGLPHHVSEKHPPMSREMRAAQFSPFAALTGYDEELDAALKREIAEIESMVQGVQIDEA